MAVNFVRATPAVGFTNGAGGGSSTDSSAFSSAVSASNIILCCATYERAAGGVTVQFQRSGDASQNAILDHYNATSDRGISIGYLTGIGANTNLVTAVFSSAVDANMCVCGVELSGADATTPIGSGEGAADYFFNGSSVDTGNGSPSVQPGKRYGFLLNFAAATHTAGTGFTSRHTMWDGGFAIGNLGQLIESDASYTTTGSQSGAQWTVGGGDYGLMIMAYVREAAAAASSAKNMLLMGVG